MAMATLKMLDTKGPFGGNVFSLVGENSVTLSVVG